MKFLLRSKVLFNGAPDLRVCQSLLHIFRVYAVLKACWTKLLSENYCEMQLTLSKKYEVGN
jgi:hypothetical protein